MDQYLSYTIMDFIQDEYFIQWVKNPDPENCAYWDGVKQLFPHQVPVMDRAVRLIGELATFYPEVPEEEIEKTREVIVSHSQQLNPAPVRRLWFYLSAAATVAIVLGSALWWYKPATTSRIITQIQSKLANEDLAENTGTGRREIKLDDGSTILLSPNSNVRYRVNGPDRREVYLDGEAVFNVTKNPDKPFYVFSNGLTTKVLGTRFKVSAYRDGSEVKVEVSSGRVSVFSTESANASQEERALILTPNQQAVYTKKDLQLVRMVVEKPRALVTPEQLKLYTYTDTPIAQIFEGLEEIYGIKVIYDKEKFKNCKLNMVLSDESLFEKLELIGKVVEARYNVIDGQVIFIGEGCNESFSN